jgi:putative sterol carrier protein
MVEFLTEPWIDELCTALSASDDRSLRDIELTLQQVVSGAPGGEVAYWLRFDRGSVSGGLGHTEAADVTFAMDHDTALALARAELNHPAAFMQGMLNVTGNMGKLLKQQVALRVLGPAMASIGGARER